MEPRVEVGSPSVSHEYPDLDDHVPRIEFYKDQLGLLAEPSKALGVNVEQHRHMTLPGHPIAPLNDVERSRRATGKVVEVLENCIPSGRISGQDALARSLERHSSDEKICEVRHAPMPDLHYEQLSRSKTTRLGGPVQM